MNDIPVNLSRFPDETDEAYYNRISNIKDYAPNQAQIIEQNKVIVRNNFKNYIVKIANLSVAERILANELFIKNPNNVKLINDNIKQFDTKLREKYDKIDVDTFITFCKSYLRKINNIENIDILKEFVKPTKELHAFDMIEVNTIKQDIIDNGHHLEKPIRDSLIKRIDNFIFEIENKYKNSMDIDNFKRLRNNILKVRSDFNIKLRIKGILPEENPYSLVPIKLDDENDDDDDDEKMEEKKKKL